MEAGPICIRALRRFFERMKYLDRLDGTARPVSRAKWKQEPAVSTGNAKKPRVVWSGHIFIRSHDLSLLA